MTASILAGLCLLAQAQAQAQSAGTPGTETMAAPAAKTGSAQDAKKQAQKDAAKLGTVVVTGIRASLAKALDTKRNADAIVDAIDAEDIGKFPTTNVAEALAQIPGVTLDRSIPATQRVSIDGMDPSLNLTLLDGHPVSQAMWLFGDNPNRGFNYSLLPSEILGRLEVYKSPEARLPEGSIGGTVIMHTVQPLDVAANTVSGTVGFDYNDMVKQSKPNASVFYSWKNQASTFGVDISAQHFEQTTSRQGLEVYSYSPVSSLAASNPALQSEIASGKIKGSDEMPNNVSASNFQQVEKRDSLNANLQFRPNEFWESRLGLMWMRDNLDNVNQSVYVWPGLRPNGITSLTEGANGIITGGSSSDVACKGDTAGACATKAITLADNFARQSTVTTKGADWQNTFHGDGWALSTDVGVSTSSNPMTSALKELAYGGSYNWSLSKGIQFTDPSTANDPDYWADYGWGGNYATLMYKARDQFAQIDFDKSFDGFINQVSVGLRYASHWESQTENVYGGAALETLSEIGYGGLSDLAGASALGLWSSSVNHVQALDAAAIRAAVLGSPGFPGFSDAVSYWDNTWAVKQKNTAAYLQADFASGDLHGNFGVRLVHTENTEQGFNVPGTCLSADTWNCDFPQGFGYVTARTSRTDVLPAVNVAYDVTSDLVLRGALSEVVGYAPYNQMAPYFEANDTVLTATAGNPDLKPYRSINADFSGEWYFADQSLLAVSFFYKDLLNYIVNASQYELRQNGSWTLPGYQTATGAAQIADGDCTASGMCLYSVTAPVNGGRAKVKGGTVNYQQPFSNSGFGVRVNYTYSDGSTAAGGPLPYNSRHSFNIGPYFEKGPYSASVSYGWRSKYLAGGYVAGAPSTTIDGYKELDASVGYQFLKNFTVSVNMLNLLNSTYYAYLGSKTQLSDEYKTGRQFMLALHFKFN
ncbi:TonB-dependent receptor [Frateuria aurantia]